MSARSSSLPKFTLFYLVILGLVLLRLWGFLTWPEMLYEDTTHMLSFFFNNNDFVYVFRQLNGYTSLLPNIIAWLSLKISFLHSPYIMTGVAIAIYSFSIFFFCLPNFRYVIEDDRIRFAVCMLLCLIPFSKGAIVANLTNSQWSLLVIFPLLLIAEPPKQLPGLVCYLFAGTLVALSHPLNIATFPLIFILLTIRPGKRQRTVYLYFLALLFLYLQSASSDTHNTTMYFKAFFDGFFMFLQRTCVELFLGATLRHELYLQGHSNTMNLTGLLISIMPVLIAWKRKLSWQTLLLILGFLGTALAFTLISQTRVTSEVGLAEINLQRFFHAPRVLLILAFATAIFHKHDPITVNIRSIVTAVILIIYPLVLSYYNSFLYINYPSVYEQNLVILTETIEELEKAKQGLPHKTVISGGGVEGWQMHFDITCHLHQRENCFAEAQERLNTISVLGMPSALQK